MNYTHEEAQRYAKLVAHEADANRFDAPKTEMLAREVIRLNEWADGMTDAMLKERSTANALIKELLAKVSALEKVIDAHEEAAVDRGWPHD